MTSSIIPFSIPKDLNRLFKDYEIKQKAFDPHGFITFVDRKDKAGSKLLSLLKGIVEASETKRFADDTIWIDKTIAYLTAKRENFGLKERLLFEKWCGKAQLLLAGKDDIPAQPAKKARSEPTDKTDLYIAAEKGETQIVKALLASGADTKVQCGPQRLTALHIAIEKEHAEVIDLILEHLDKMSVIKSYKTGLGMQNPAVNVCFLNATLQALRSCPPFRQFLKRCQETSRSVKDDPFLDLLKLSPGDRSFLFKTLAIALGYYPEIDGKEASVFDKKKPLQERQTFLVSGLESLPLKVEQKAFLLSLLSASDESRLDLLGPLFLESLIALYTSCEEGVGNSVDSATIQALRHMARVSGFQSRSPTSQEDAQEFLLYLLDVLKAPTFFTKRDISYKLDFKVPSFELQRDNHKFLLLEVTKAAPGTSLQQLINSNSIDEEIDRRAILTADSYKPSAEQRPIIEALPPLSMVQTKQAILLKSDQLPDFLPISLKRYLFLSETQIHKIETEFPLSKTLTFTLEDDRTKSATYKLSSFVVHDGPTPFVGHYRSYVLAEQESHEFFVEYNDTTITVNPDEARVLDCAATSGYLFFYKRIS